MFRDINGRLLSGAEIDGRTACFGSRSDYRNVNTTGGR
jgi:hypothetical protein